MFCFFVKEDGMNENFFLDLLDRLFFFHLVKAKVKPFNRLGVHKT